jgi:hypothetical protein
MEKPQRTMLGYFALKYGFLNDGLFTFIQKLPKDRLSSIVKQVYDDTIENIFYSMNITGVFNSFPDRKEYAIALLAMASDQVNNLHQVDVVVALVRIIDASVLSSHAKQVIDLMMESNPLWVRQMQTALAL